MSAQLDVVLLDKTLPRATCDMHSVYGYGGWESLAFYIFSWLSLNSSLTVVVIPSGCDRTRLVTVEARSLQASEHKCTASRRKRQENSGQSKTHTTPVSSDLGS